MNIKIYKKKEKNDEIRLRLKSVDGSIMLMVVDVDGKKVFGGNLLEIRNEGIIIRRPAVTVSGFQTDSTGRVEIR